MAKARNIKDTVTASRSNLRSEVRSLVGTNGH